MINFIKTTVNGIKNYIDKKIFDLKQYTNEKFISSKANWNQNDENANNYIENRPFYSEFGKILFNGIATNYGEGGLTFNYAFDGIYPNTNYILVINNTEYNAISNNSGNKITTATDVGYYITKETSTSTLRGNNIDSLSSASIKLIGWEYVQIDDKFLSNNIARTSEFDNKMDIVNPIGTGSFSMNRKANSTIGISSYTEGKNTTASGNYSHAEGYETIASGYSSHAEGKHTDARSRCSHAKGEGTIAFGTGSYAEGQSTVAYGACQHVQGRYNILSYVPEEENYHQYAHIVGNGLSTANRSNAHTLDWDGNAWYSGDVYVGSTSGTNMDEGSKKLATEEYVDEQITAIPSDTFIITFTKDSDDVYSADKTYEEVLEAVNSGKTCLGRAASGGQTFYYYGVVKNVTLDTTDIWFTHTANARTIVFQLTSSNNVNLLTTQLVRETENSLTTTDKTITGAINEINDKVGTDSVQTQISSAIADLVDTAPETLDTLSELATAIQENDSVIDTLNAAIANKADKNLIVTITSTTADDGSVTYSADKTFAEIAEAYEDGREVILTYSDTIYNLKEEVTSNSDYACFGNSNFLGYNLFYIDFENNIRHNFDNLREYEFKYFNTTNKTIEGAINELNTNKVNTSIVESTYETKEDATAKLTEAKSYVDIRVPAWTESDEGAILKIVNNTPTWIIE